MRLKRGAQAAGEELEQQLLEFVMGVVVNKRLDLLAFARFAEPFFLHCLNEALYGLDLRGRPDDNRIAFRQQAV